MLLNFDAAQLEWRAVVHLSGDKTGIREIEEGLDFHSDNKKKFSLPDRLTAKKFLFRAIYKGTAYAYSVDNDFKHLGGQKYWQKVIDAFYEKYNGIYRYHNTLLQQAQMTGRVISETGRIYPFEPKLKRGEMVWPVNEIVNYPVQGFSADLMMMARIYVKRKLEEQYGDLIKQKKILFCNTVHDSVVLDVDVDKETWYNICITVKKVFNDLPVIFNKLYGKQLMVPMDCDAAVGINWLWMHKIKVDI